MIEALFIRQNSKIWADLEVLLERKTKSFNDIERLTSLYRMVSGHLNYVRHHYRTGKLCDYLEELAARAHTTIYANTKPRTSRRFFSQILPLALKTNSKPIWVSAAVFLLAALISFMVGMLRPEYVDVFLPEGFSAADLRTEQADLEGQSGSAVLSNFIMVNNIQVSALAFALGLTFGVGTVYVLFMNGCMLGALASIFAGYGNSLFFWSLILPHGVLELTAIFIAGGAGLGIGYSLIRPGAYSRKDALLTAARKALGLMGLVVLLLIVAALIEGFFTPLPIAEGIKLAVALLTALPLICYLHHCGRPFTER